MVLLPGNKIIAMLRTNDRSLPKEMKAADAAYLYQSDSYDRGLRWTEPRNAGIWGHPAHLFYLQEKRNILCVYGYRKKPFGIRACLSSDFGQSWDLENEIIISDDGSGIDLGYPVSVQLEDERILAVYYFYKEGKVRFIACSIYKID